jgi:hypothetical protein
MLLRMWEDVRLKGEGMKKATGTARSAMALRVLDVGIFGKLKSWYRFKEEICG